MTSATTPINRVSTAMQVRHVQVYFEHTDTTETLALPAGVLVRDYLEERGRGDEKFVELPRTGAMGTLRV